MKILLFGESGQLGSELVRSLHMVGDILSLDRLRHDFLWPDRIRDEIRRMKPDVVVNAAAMTKVDAAEMKESDAFQINAITPGVIADAVKEYDGMLFHYSTDYVFDGQLKRAYVESDEATPLNVYGKSKLLGEELIRDSGCRFVIFRTSWLYSLTKDDFLLKILSQVLRGRELSVVVDEFGSPTWCRTLADISLIYLMQSVHSDRVHECKTFHVASRGGVSRYEFTRCFLDNLCMTGFIGEYELHGITSSEFGSIVSRPRSSVLAVDKIEKELRIEMPDWRESLGLCVKEFSRNHKIHSEITELKIH